MADQIYYEYYETMAGILTVAADNEAVTLVSFGPKEIGDGRKGGNKMTEWAACELLEYFGGVRRTFTVPIRFDAGTPFQKQVWHELLAIPYGETRTYGEIAENLHRPGAARAVGMANHHNPLVILVPCHRVIGADGTLTGYAGGLRRKKLLLSLEQGEKPDTP